MANLQETPVYDAGVYQLETSDPVLGGPDGPSNAPLKNLANRTAYLKGRVDDLEAGVWLPSVDYPNQILPHGCYRTIGDGYDSIRNADVTFMPYIARTKQTIKRVATYVETAETGGTIRLGLYSWLGNRPNTRMHDFGSVSTATKGFKSLIPNVVINPGLYALAYVSSNSGALRVAQMSVDLAARNDILGYEPGVIPGFTIGALGVAGSGDSIPAQFNRESYSRISAQNLMLIMLEVERA
jgi:hypothetical protein